METRFLESLIAVVERGSVADAARALNLTPAAISQRMQALEAEIGAPLLVRSGRTLKPTQAGMAVADHARTIVRDIRALCSLAVEGEPVGDLRLGAIETAMTGILPDLLKRCSAAFPRIDIRVEPGTSRDLYPKVMRGELDAGIIMRPEFALPKAGEWRVLREEPLILIAPADVRERDPHVVLRKHPFIRYNQSQWGGRLVDTYLRQSGVRVRERFELDSLDAIAVLVDRGMGVALVPDWAPPWPAGLHLRRYSLKDSALVRQTGAIWLRASKRAPHVRAFLGTWAA
jgi:DNA-binding transcriptional LysR family regulator